MNTAAPQPGTQQMQATCTHCGEKIIGEYSRRAARYDQWRHYVNYSDPTLDGPKECDTGRAAVYANEKARNLR